MMTGESMRAWRRRHGLTQAQAAECLGLQPVTISQYERGVRRLPNTVALLCATYDCLSDTSVNVSDAHAYLEKKSAQNNP